jgi:hypothetical protein
MNVVDLTSLLAYLAAGGAAFFLPGLFDRLGWFQALAPTGKQLTVALTALLITLLAVGVQGLLVQYPLVSAQLDPYVKSALITINILITQFQHGSVKAALMRAQFDQGDSARGGQ